MNINRNNYEEYFLLYADKELSATEKNMVEMFVQQNPDLEEEFVMLQQSVVKPDNTIELKDKSFLFRKGNFIDHNNYEEKFVLYNDNELSLSEVDEIEKFVQSNPSLKNEFILQQQIKYEPDTSIRFPHKKSLYKKEDDTKVIPFPWKAMAAAALLGIGLWIGINYLPENKIEPAVVTKKTIPIEKTIVKPMEQKDDAKDIPLVKTKDNQNEPSPKNEENEFKSVQKQQPQQNVTVKNIPVNNNSKVNKIPEKKNEDVVINKPTEKTEIINSNDNPSEPLTKNVNNQSSLKNYAQPASYIADAEIKSENYVFYNITTEEFKKSKVGTFLKKVKRTIERKIPVKNNRVKIGTVEIAKDDLN